MKQRQTKREKEMYKWMKDLYDDLSQWNDDWTKSMLWKITPFFEKFKQKKDK